MSLIYVGADRADVSVEKLYHHVQVAERTGPASLFSSSASGTIRYELFVRDTSGVDSFHFGVPYPAVSSVTDATERLSETSEERLLGVDNGKTINEDGTTYTVRSIDPNRIEMSTESFQGLEYTSVSIDTADLALDDSVAFGIELVVPSLAVNVATSLLQESTWALDLTLYGPVNPREHRFLDRHTDVSHEVLAVEQAYTYLFLPENVFPKTVSPTPLESFYYGSEANFYYIWVCGQLDPWYEQRMLVTYGSYNNSAVAAILIGILGSLIVTVATALVTLF